MKGQAGTTEQVQQRKRRTHSNDEYNYFGIQTEKKLNTYTN